MNPEAYCRSGVKTVNFDPSGGSAELTSTEIAAALRGCPDIAYYLATQVLLDHNHTNKIAGKIYDKIKHHKTHKSKTELGKPILVNMALLIVSEVTGSNTCITCGGTGLLNTINSCPHCRHGKSYPTESQKQNFCQMDNWNRWRHIYDKAYSDASGYLSDAYQKLAIE